MVYKRSFYPEILIHPWMSLKDILESEDMTQKDLSLRTDISEKHISNIIKAKASITPDTALKLKKVFWISSDFWNNLQKAYDEDLARIEEKALMSDRIEEEKSILSEIKDWYKNLELLWFFPKLVYNEKNQEIILNNLYSFFWLSSLKNILEIFNINKMWLNFKKTESLKLNKYNLACWLRAWEKKIEDLSIWEYSKDRLKEVLPELKSMTNNEFINISKIQELLLNVGIYFSFVEWFTNVPVFWITRRYKWIPFVQVSDRGKRNDTFWFALFHELAHVQLHLHKKDDILININDNEENKEQEANKWASNYFINEKDYRDFLNSWNITIDKLVEFSNKNWVWSNIVAWRLWFDHDIFWWEISKLRTPLKLINY